LVERRTPNPDAGGSNPSWPANLDMWMANIKETVETVKRFLKEVRAELKKVTWTGRKEVTSGTIAVLLMSAVIAVFLWLTDLGISSVIRIFMT
jgi:preprotein translocase subunit SecE